MKNILIQKIIEKKLAKFAFIDCQRVCHPCIGCA